MAPIYSDTGSAIRIKNIILMQEKVSRKDYRMTRIKIKSNPYTKEILYSTFDEASRGWINLKDSDAGKSSELRETDERFFLPFRIKEIINIIKKEYYVGDKIQICFEGTQDEYAEVAAICESEDNKDKIELVRSKEFLENARFIKPDIKEVFENVEPVIDNIMKENSYVIKELNKVAKALDDIIPICVFGTYSAGKSTFINALIGVEILPSGGDPVTAKIYEISNSEQPDQAKISFKYLDEEIEISIEKDGMRVLRGKQDIDIIEKIRLAVEENENVDFYNNVRIAVDILNNYEKRDKETIELGSVISLSIPFSEKSIIGNTNNKFVIFDTPGSNSYSN
nr:dynamin family protein [Eubacterium sp.]